MSISERTGAFVAALDPDILIVEDVEESTAITPPAVLVELAAEMRPPTPLGLEARELAARVRYVLAMECAWPHSMIDDVLRRAHDLMPRVRR